MKSVMVFNFRTMQFEQATEAECKDWLSLIDNLNSDCAAQQPRAVDAASLKGKNMLPLTLYARNEHQGVLIFCPHCKMGVRHDSGDISNAIHDGLEIVCVACEKPFKIVVMSLTRVAEQRDAPVHAEQKCPRCEGVGHYVDYIGKRVCLLCNGTGISNRSAGG